MVADAYRTYLEQPRKNLSETEKYIYDFIHNRVGRIDYRFAKASVNEDVLMFS